VVTGQKRNDVLPGPRTAGNAVDEQDGRTVAGASEAHLVAVDGDVLDTGGFRGYVDVPI